MEIKTSGQIINFLNMLNIEHFCYDGENGLTEFKSFSTLKDCSNDSLIFLHSLGKNFDDRIQLIKNKNPAIIITTEAILKMLDSLSCIITVDNPRYVFSLLAKNNLPHVQEEVGINSKAYIYEQFCKIASDVSIGPFAVIGDIGISKNNFKDGIENTAHIGNCIIKKGTRIGAHTHIARAVLGNTVIDENCILAHNVSVGHGCKIGKRVCICPGVVISGSCTVGNDTWIAPNVTINEGINIGSNCFIGSGSVVTKDIPDNRLAYGVPAKLEMEYVDFPW